MCYPRAVSGRRAVVRLLSSATREPLSAQNELAVSPAPVGVGGLEPYTCQVDPEPGAAGDGELVEGGAHSLCRCDCRPVEQNRHIQGVNSDMAQSVHRPHRHPAAATRAVQTIGAGRGVGDGQSSVVRGVNDPPDGRLLDHERSRHPAAACRV